MSRSNRKSTTASRKTAPVATTTTTSRSGGASAPSREAVVHESRDITRYTFEYQRDRVSRRAGSSYFRVEGTTSDEGLEMTLQEAQSLYNFLGKALAR
jgi:hypothetical protein